MTALRRLLVGLAFALPLLFLALFFFYPLAEIFRVSFLPEGRLDLSGFAALWQRPYLRNTLLFTAGQALLSTVLTLIAALPATYFFARYDFRGKTLLRALLTVPFVMPTVVVATAFLALLGPRGLLNEALMALFRLDAPPIAWQQSLLMILLAHIFYNLAVVIRVVGGFWANLDPTLEEAAAMLGASPWQRFRRVTLPLLMPSLGAAALLIFLFTFSSFGVVLILGGLAYATLEVEIYRQALTFFNLPLAATLSLVQMVAIFLMMSLYTALQNRTTVPLQLRGQESALRPLTGRLRLLWLLAVGTPTLFVAAPLLALVIRSLQVRGEWSLRFYRALGETGGRSILDVAPELAIRNSLLFALATLLLSLLIGTLSAYLLAPPQSGQRARWRSLLDPIFLLPLGTSAVTLGFGYIIALDEPPLNLRTSALLVPLAHTLIAFPFVVRSLLPVLRSISPSLREAAAMLGAAPWQVWRQVDLPIVARGLLVGATFAFAVSIGEFGATSLVQRPEWPTMTVVIFRFLGQPGIENYGKAVAMSVIIMSITIIGFLLIERFRIDDIGEF
ncbi:MAG: iron ABC transporter permease [Anaerolineales bacterium]|nr:iron ABC transporter permease [Anaerolineales bacterium]